MKTNTCPLCNGQKIASTTTFTVDLGSSLIVVRNTPAMVCSLCGEAWISDSVSENLEQLVLEAKAKQRVVEIVDFKLESVA